MDYIAIILAIIFLLLSISKLKDKVIQKDNHFKEMQKYLDECKRINNEI